MNPLGSPWSPYILIASPVRWFRHPIPCIADPPWQKCEWILRVVIRTGCACPLTGLRQYIWPVRHQSVTLTSDDLLLIRLSGIKIQYYMKSNNFFDHETACVNVVCNITSILFRPQFATKTYNVSTSGFLIARATIQSPDVTFLIEIMLTIGKCDSYDYGFYSLICKFPWLPAYNNYKSQVLFEAFKRPL